MSQIRQVDATGNVVEETAQEIAASPTTEMAGGESEDFLAVAQVMNLDEKERNNYKDEINTLIKWAKTQDDYKDTVNLKWILHSLQAKLGTPPLSERWITRASRYAYLDLESKRVESEKINLME
jgi:hypothetical protein